MPRSKFAKDAHAKRETFAAYAILGEKGNRYRIGWKGIDPATGAPYEPTWEPKRYANAALKHEWAEKKAKQRRAMKQTPSSTENSVSTSDYAPKEPVGFRPSAEKSVAKTPTAEQPLTKPLPTDKLAIEKPSACKATTRRIVTEKLAKARSARATTTRRVVTAKPSASHLLANEPPVIDISDTESVSTASSTTITPTTEGSTSTKPAIATSRRNHKPTQEYIKSQTSNGETQREGRATGHSGLCPSGSTIARSSTSLSSSSTFYSSCVSQSSLSTSSTAASTSTSSSSPKKRRRPATRWATKKPAHRLQSAQTHDSDTYFPSRGIVDESADKYLVSWSPHPVTGEAYADTWEPKGYVMPFMVDEWEQRKIMLLVKAAEERMMGAGAM
ncbi:chromo domain-like protein [Diplodia corticola]|uniref:Chromo domain-like protein n=1 Tax=Diplodia corticola TaxID=236234 RepID=A0A1J9S257_9PEZI|nr:chromo domain-like protein [Diplodia corticola]OJD34092.1 chromo domain-like protein [Diplodia corticola]